MDTRPRTSLISFCTVQLRTLCAAHSLATLCLCTTSGPDPGELPGFWGSMVFRHAPIPRKGSGNQQQQTSRRRVPVVTGTLGKSQPKWGRGPHHHVEAAVDWCSIIAGSPSSSPNFPNCSSPRESASVYAAYLRSHFSVSQPKTLRSRARGYLSELRRATCLEESHSSFCSPFSSTELLAAASNLSTSTATGPDKVAYPMLKYLPRSGMDFLLHIFNLSWSSHSFPSIWKTSSIIPIHKMGKPLDSPASFRPMSLTSCVSKLFERIIISRLLFLLESNSILSPRQDGFRPGRSTLDQILFLSQSISDGFNKPRPGSGTILSTIDFSKAFDSVWHPALFHKLISASRTGGVLFH